MSRIVIADPHPFIREALRQRLSLAGHDVVGETSDGREALALVQRLHPDLLILDLDLPRLGGLELLHRLRSEKSRQKALVFTHLSGAHYHELTQQAGAQAFVHKDGQPAELDEAVKLVLSGRKVFPARASGAPQQGEPHGEHITPRELTVLQYLAQGYRIKDIAEELAISDRTVSTYKTRLLEKTQTDSLIDLVDAAHARGLLDNHQISRLAQAPATSTGGAQGLIQLMEILPNAVSLWSSDGVLLACNQRFAEVHRRSTEQILGSHIFELGMTAPDHIERAQQEFLKGAAGEAPFSLIAAALQDGIRHSYRLIGVPLKDEAGASIGVLCSYVDITEHERYVERLQESKAYLESLFASRAAFLLSSGHELLHELTALSTLLDTSRAQHPQDAGLEQAPRYLDRLRDKLEVLIELIGLEKGNVLTIPRSEELNRLTRTALAGTRPRQHFQPAGEDYWAWIDPNRYLQLLDVLLRSLDKARLPALTIQAKGTPLPYAEVEWSLCLRSSAGEPIQAHLEGLGAQARLQLARRLCRVLGGELQVGSPTQPDVAALIQLKLPKGTPRI